MFLWLVKSWSHFCLKSEINSCFWDNLNTQMHQILQIPNTYTQKHTKTHYNHHQEENQLQHINIYKSDPSRLMWNVINFPMLTESLVKRARVIDVKYRFVSRTLNNQQNDVVCVCGSTCHVGCVTLCWVCFAVTSHTLYVCLHFPNCQRVSLCLYKHIWNTVNCVGGDWYSFMYRSELKGNSDAIELCHAGKTTSPSTTRKTVSHFV